MAHGGKRRKIRMPHVWLGVLAVLSVGVVGAVLIPRPAAEVAVTSRPVVTPMATPTALDNLAPLRQALAANAPVTVYGLGSSVGNGATLPDPATQAPVAYLSQQLGALTKGGATAVNLSVDGSVVSEGVRLYREKVAPNRPTVLLLAYGMNDGAPGSFNSGQTLPGAVSAMTAIARAAMQDGTTVLIATTPSPHTVRADYALPAGQKVAYPQGGKMAPADPVVQIDGAPFSARHQIFNQKMTDVSSLTGATLVDVVPSWIVAVVERGEDAMYGPQERVHPNLAGHTASYRQAIDAFVASLRG